MKLKDLKTGYRVTTKEGIKYNILLNTEWGDIMINPHKDSHGWLVLTDYDDTLSIDNVYNEKFGIILVEKPIHKYDICYHFTGWEVVWERNAIPELEAGMIVALEEGKGNHIVVENDGKLYLVDTESSSGTYVNVGEYNKDLTHPDFDIFNIESIWESNPDKGFFMGDKLLWERE